MKRLLHALVLSVFLYVCESGTLKAGLQSGLQVAEIIHFRHLLGIFYTVRITNKMSMQKSESRDYKNMLTAIKNRKLKLHEQIARPLQEHPTRNGKRRKKKGTSKKEVAKKKSC